MKINPSGAINNPYQKTVKAQGAAQAAPQKTDKLEISKEAKDMLNSDKIDPARQAKVDALKHKVESGDYKVDAEETARKFYDFWTKQ